MLYAHTFSGQIDTGFIIEAQLNHIFKERIQPDSLRQSGKRRVAGIPQSLRNQFRPVIDAEHIFRPTFNRISRPTLNPQRGIREIIFFQIHSIALQGDGQRKRLKNGARFVRFLHAEIRPDFAGQIRHILFVLERIEFPGNTSLYIRSFFDFCRIQRSFCRCRQSFAANFRPGLIIFPFFPRLFFPLFPVLNILNQIFDA